MFEGTTHHDGHVEPLLLDMAWARLNFRQLVAFKILDGLLLGVDQENRLRLQGGLQGGLHPSTRTAMDNCKNEEVTCR